MAQLLAGKVAAITGGVTGIGRAIAVEFVRQGARVVVNHLGDERSREQFKSMAQEVGAHSDSLIEVGGDVAKPETGEALVKSCVERWGKLDVFVSNAGVCQFREFLEYASSPAPRARSK